MKLNKFKDSKGRFIKGHPSHNKGKKGIHPSPKTEFKKGNFPSNGKPVGSVYINSVGRADIKVAHPNVWKRRAHYIWKTHNGTIKKGMLVHHIDGNCLNDNIENLELMTRAEHLLTHRKEFEEKRAKKSAAAVKKYFKLKRISKLNLTYGHVSQTFLL